MLHELLLVLLGHPGDIFDSETFEISSGFPDLHPGERATLERLGSLGKRFQLISNYSDNSTSNEFENALKVSLKSHLNEYQNDVIGLEKGILELNQATIHTIESKLEKVLGSLIISITASSKKLSSYFPKLQIFMGFKF